MKRNTHIAPIGALFILGLFLSGCASTMPEIRSFVMDSGALVIHVPSSEWKSQSPEASRAMVDITYHTDDALPTYINITLRGKKKAPSAVSGASLIADGQTYALSDIKPLKASSKSREYRLSSSISNGDLKKIMAASALELDVTVEGAVWKFVPGTTALQLKEQFTEDYLY